jgi:hypothetical protein
LLLEVELLPLRVQNVQVVGQAVFISVNQMPIVSATTRSVDGRPCAFIGR